MTLEEKVGQLLIKQIPAGINGTIDNTTFILDGTRNLTTAPLIREKLLSHLTASMVVALIKGFQGESLGLKSVTTVTKHFPGAGPSRNGNDSHFATGKDDIYFGDFLDHHLIPFKAAIAAGVAFGSNKPVITGLLREELGFEGIVVSDWGLITDQAILGVVEPARAWGVENTTELKRATMVLDAGVDQFGGEICTELLIQLVQDGQIPESRLDIPVRKLLKEKFLLELFDHRFVDPEDADKVVGTPYFTRIGNEIQRRAYTLLTNQMNTVPLRSGDGVNLYARGFNASHLEAHGFRVVDEPDKANFCFFRLSTPYEARGSPFRQRYHEGRLDFNAYKKLPTRNSSTPVRL
ncbi:beta-glucosidase C [Aureobasidium pullulans]|uniref:beta-glucosidase n=1 Tax=Aureobasidium pullulans TaxID=5580 RepID=A0A4T0BKJ3_AURPU|nr:beta-glucosidase C [Aureobasidium pullulans]